MFGNSDDGFGQAHLEVELAGDGFLEEADVAVIDVTAVLAEVDGDAVRSGKLALNGGPDGVRLDGSAGLPDGCYVVYVYVQDWHIVIPCASGATDARAGRPRHCGGCSFYVRRYYMGAGAGIKEISVYLIAKSRLGD